MRLAENIRNVILICTLVRGECREAGFGCLYTRYRVHGRLEPETRGAKKCLLKFLDAFSD